MASMEDDNLATTTLRVALVIWRLSNGERLSTRQIADGTGLSYRGAWAMMDRLTGSHHIPLTWMEGTWLIARG